MSANILIVDDEIFRYMVVDVLNQHGYSTAEMENGEKAFRYYAKHPEDVDLVILDMVLPEAGEGKIYKLLKQKYPPLKIIMISGRWLGYDVKKYIIENADIFLHTPFSNNELISTIRRVLEKKES